MAYEEPKYNLIKKTEVYESKNIISNIPIWNFANIYSGTFKNKMDKISRKYNKSC